MNGLRSAVSAVPARARKLLHGLWFLPGAIVVAYAALALLLATSVGEFLDPGDRFWTFGGDASAARDLLSTVAGSLITIAGVTFSITILVLQLASGQFTPRALPSFFADRTTQVTIGVFVGTFVYCLLVLRSIREGDNGIDLVPRLSITLGTAFAVVALALFVVFIHHIAQMIQVSNVTARIAHQTLARIDDLYPERYGRAVDESAESALARWSADPGAEILPERPGFIQSVDLAELAAELDGHAAAVHVRAVPGAFASIETPLATVWPADEAPRAADAVRQAVTIANERDLTDDAAFGVRQLGDIALRAMSPSVNDPTTAVTCVDYLRTILVRLAGRVFPAPVRRLEGHALTVVAERREFETFLMELGEVGRSATRDTRVMRALVRATGAIAAAACEAGADDRAGAAVDLARTLAAQGLAEATSDRDAEFLREALGEVERAAASGRSAGLASG